MGTRTLRGAGSSPQVWVSVLLFLCLIDARAESLAAIGERLFTDQALSLDGSIACASCHRPGYAFAEPSPVPTGVAGRQGTRNVPSLLDVAQRPTLTWDGRTDALRDQVLVAFTHPREHGLANIDALTKRLPGAMSLETVQDALTAYLATLTTDETAFDRWQAGDTSAMSASAKRGYEVFVGRGECAQCNRVEKGRPSFTDNGFHRVGVGLEAIAPKLAMLTARVQKLSPADIEATIAEDSAVAALGRYVVTRSPADIGKYRTPSLRNVAITAPYFHDGSVPTLEAAVAQEIYYRSQERGRALALNIVDQADLVAFLRALTDTRYERDSAPASLKGK